MLLAVYADGSICLDILQNHWSPIYDVGAILTSIQVGLRVGVPYFRNEAPAGKKSDTLPLHLHLMRPSHAVAAV